MEWMINGEHHGMLIREYLRSIHLFSKRMLIAIKFDGGEILVNGNPETVRFRLTTGDQLTIKFPPEKKGYNMKPEEIPLSIIYEDADIIVLNKLSGMATMPSPQHQSGTIANGLLDYYEKNDIPYTVHIVTRLDRDTSGLLLIAKHSHIHSLLSQSLINGQVERKYKAIIEGRLEESQGTINANIGRREGSIIERTVVATGKEAITHYQTVSDSSEHTLVDIVLETGRTHQIRVHFSHIGYPLAGDDLYGGSHDKIKRQALHCDQISFEHPITKESVSFNAPMPDDMKSLILPQLNEK